MAMGDPFGTAYQGAFDATTNRINRQVAPQERAVANQQQLQQNQAVLQQKQQMEQQQLQQKQANALKFMTQFGIIRQDKPELSTDELENNLKDWAKKGNVSLDIKADSFKDDAEKRNHLIATFKQFGLPVPEGQTKTIFDMDKAKQMGISADSEGSVSIAPKQTYSFQQEKYADTKENADEIATAMMDGRQPLEFKGLYGASPLVRAALERKGVDVKQLMYQTQAEQQLIRTKNAPAQVRLRQLIQSSTDGLDVLDDLNKQLKRTGIKAFNRGQLQFLANGGGTKDQQELAAQFITQTNTIVDELGGVFMGGNTPTDKAIGLAQEILRSDFNDTSLSGAIKQLKTNLNIRGSAIDSVQAEGLQGPYGKGRALTNAAGITKDEENMSDADAYQEYLNLKGGQ